MVLQISEARGVFSVFGELNTYNVGILTRHIGNYIKKDQRVILNLERVKQLDANAAFTLKNLFMEAIGKSSIFSIVAWENKNVMTVLEQTKASYIVSSDRY
jgi:ABC-type transporter Mla MlaB component